jgi:predicted amidohydrolase YtcJ
VVLPGLHDHHVHLRALAAAGASVVAGPPLFGPEEAVSPARAVAETARR